MLPLAAGQPAPQNAPGQRAGFLAGLAEAAVGRAAALLGRPGGRGRALLRPLLLLIGTVGRWACYHFDVLHPRSAAAIIRRDSQVLFLARSDGKLLCLPGGVILPWESEENCLVREVEEETGLRVLSFSLLGEMKRCVYFEVVATGDVRSSWEGQPTWIEAASLPQRTNVWLHEELQAYLSGASSLQLSRGKLQHPIYKPV